MTIAPPLAPAPPPAAAGDASPTVTSYADFVRRYRLLLAGAVVLGLLTGALAHLAKPLQFTSTADMVIVATAVVEADGTERDVSIDSALQLLRSDRVIGHVARELDYPGGATGLDGDVITRPVINSRIVRLSVAAPDPELAQRSTSALVDRFFELRQQGLLSSARGRAQAVDSELAAVELELAHLYGLVTDAQVATSGDDAESAGAAARPTVDVGTLVRLRAQLHGEQASLALVDPNPGYLRRPATEPRGGARPGMAITMSSALTLSLLAAVAVGALHQTRGNRARAGVGTDLTTEGAPHGTAGPGAEPGRHHRHQGPPGATAQGDRRDPGPGLPGRHPADYRL